MSTVSFASPLLAETLRKVLSANSFMKDLGPEQLVKQRMGKLLRLMLLGFHLRIMARGNLRAMFLILVIARGNSEPGFTS